MKIHVVQKGETLWEIANKYGVDFEELIQLNSHLSNPDMIMPGMKIKVPGSSVQVKKEGSLDKEMKKYPAKPEEKKQQENKGTKQSPPKPKDKKEGEAKKHPAKHPWKDTSPKAFPVIKEDDGKKGKKEGIPMKPMDFPKVPMMEQHMEKFPANMNIPSLPKYDAPKKPMDSKPKGKDEQKKWKQDEFEMPAPSAPSHQPMMPINYYPAMPYCIPVNPMPMPMPMPLQNYPMTEPSSHPCGPLYGVENHSHGYQQYDYPAVEGIQQGMEGLMESSSMEMPQLPQNLAGMYSDDCGCGGSSPVPYADYGQQYQQPLQGGNPGQYMMNQGFGYPAQNMQGGYPGMQPMGGQSMYPSYYQSPSYQQPFGQQQPGMYPDYANYPGGQQPFTGMSDFNPPYPAYSREEDEEEESE
ncbi:spore coat assembly protein SafA [Sediminibacillus albus]|uniref:Spore coat assembly protein SafA n=1 Tax=Sediminibacillus albus TaxID=407036 RepID=A0A1G9BLY2_9BACI|nr:SafA/ExsA family spore coat assembly protein [Sediminibacillus albus]SDK40501.1 spore coat assembly protein SafA [Sediminibacillus albus]